VNKQSFGLTLGLGLALLATACAGDGDGSPARAAAGSGGTSGAPGGTSGGGGSASDAFAGCSKGLLESDREEDSDVALAGPGVDPETGALKSGSYLIATTYLAVKPEKIARALELGGPVVQSLFTMQGFVAFSSTASVSCATLRTLTIWESEEDMLNFVVSRAHLEAMAEISDLSRGTSNTVSWQGSEQDTSWERAAALLASESSGDL
jgi:heme-degrading monooxygenase HmoA